MESRIAFVTGASGLLGSNLVQQLRAQGFSVRALVRSLEKGRRQLPDREVQLVAGDMGDIAAFAPHLKGVDVLFHTAAYFRESFGPDADEPQMRRINVDGTLALFEAALAQGVPTLVATSALGVIRRPAGGAPFDETAPANTATHNAYFRSKIAAEQAIAQWLETPAVRAQSPRVVQILPGGMWGPGDAAPTGFGQFVLDYLAGKLPVVLPGGVPFVDARDVAAAHIAAAAQGRPGERYIVSQRMVSIAEIVATLAQVSGVGAPRVRLSFPVATALAFGAELAARVTGRPPALSRQVLHALSGDFAASSAKAERELGVRFHPIAETLRDAVEWFRANGYSSAPAGIGATQTGRARS